eukprot:scaffold1184_cov19-Tisochrysis_lutea.AAC.1
MNETQARSGRMQFGSMANSSTSSATQGITEAPLCTTQSFDQQGLKSMRQHLASQCQVPGPCGL